MTEYPSQERLCRLAFTAPPLRLKTGPVPFSDPCINLMSFASPFVAGLKPWLVSLGIAIPLSTVAPFLNRLMNWAEPQAFKAPRDSDSLASNGGPPPPSSACPLCGQQVCRYRHYLHGLLCMRPSRSISAALVMASTEPPHLLPGKRIWMVSGLQSRGRWATVNSLYTVLLSHASPSLTQRCT
jgi:hypothetical protein